jgi:Tol biopolymer transport system component/predicted Ser/Thr protein kinase
MHDDETVTALPADVQVGRQFGVYRVEGLLGAGGMGYVFRAVDTRLNRPVALKICSERFGERFDREARAISAFNHPHVCTLYDIGPNYLVMELIDGETLSAHIGKGPLPLEEVLRYGAQIADALTEAHRAGIVHRDLKPGNVMISRHGVKVLDFGLAKMTEAAEPTITQPFAVMGTPAYMAPEQIAGRLADPRSDLFALGLMLYEMTTGQLPLPGASLGSVLHRGGHATVTPPSRLRTEASPALDDLIARLLAADPARRPANGAVVAAELRTIAAPKSRASHMGLVAGGAVIVAIVLAASWWFTRGTREPVRLEVVGATPLTNLPGNKLDPAFSPDGSAIAFSWTGLDGKSPGIYVFDVAGSAAMPRRLTQSGFEDVSPAWSPNGTEIAFERVKPSEPDNELIVVRVADGVERKLRAVRQSVPLSDSSRPLLAWTPDGKAIVIPTFDVDSGNRSSLFRVGVDGGTATRLFASTGGDGDGYPALSPDGRWLAYALVERGSARLFVRRLGVDGAPEGPPQEISAGAGTNRARLRSPMWSPDGRLVFAVGGRLMEWEVNGQTRELWVSPDRPQAVTAHWTKGVLEQIVYASSNSRYELRELRLDSTGRRAEGPATAFLPLGSVAGPAFSPDGHWLAFANGASLWVATADGRNPRKLADLIPGSGTHVSPDSRQIAFHSVGDLYAPLYVVDVDGSTPPRKVAQTQSVALVGASWSADGKYLYTMAVNKTPQRVMRARVSDGELEDLFDGSTPVVSADGSRVFYKKGLRVSPIYSRSLEGHVATNPEEQVVPECAMVFGIEPTTKGIYYVSCDERAAKPVALRFFDFALRRSFDLGPPPDASQPILTVSPDGRRLVYQTTIFDNDELTRVTFRPGGS